MSLAEKLNPDRFTEMSPTMTAIVGLGTWPVRAYAVVGAQRFAAQTRWRPALATDSRPIKNGDIGGFFDRSVPATHWRPGVW